MGYDETLFTVLRSGNELDLRDPDPDAVSFDDMVANLARITRYVGSEQNVAQHSLYVARHLDEQGYDRSVQLHGLLHDAAEAYLGDVPRPTKNLDEDFETTLSHYEDRILDAIYTALDLTLPNAETEHVVKQADTEVALIELKQLGTDGVVEQTVDRFPGWTLEQVERLYRQTDWWQATDWDADRKKAEQQFRDRFDELRS